MVLSWWGLRSVEFWLWRKHGGHYGLCGLGRQSVIPYIHGECCIAVGVCCSSMELNLVASAIYPAFYSPRLGSYTVT
jgi:hypothetical protein